MFVGGGNGRGAQVEAPQAPQQEFNLRIRLNAELAGIRQQIETFASNDPLSREIHDWYYGFTQDMRNPHLEEQGILERRVALLRAILIDPITQVPLDNNAFLGNDGHTYNSRILSLHLLTIPEQERDRYFPMGNPLNQEEFLLEPHHTARHLIGWLNHYEALEPNEELEREYQAIDPADRRYLIPTRENQVMRHLLRRRRENERARVEREEAIRGVGLEAVEQLAQGFANIGERLQGFQEHVNQRLNRVEHVDRIAEEEINANINRLDQEIGQLNEEIHVLREALNELGEAVDAGERRNIENQIAIKEVKKAIKEKKKQFWITLSIAVGAIAACALATWAAPYIGKAALSATGWSMPAGVSMKAAFYPVVEGLKKAIMFGVTVSL